MTTDYANSGGLIALALKRAGVSHLFTLNGGHIWPILMGAVEYDIRIIDVRHEQSAAFAAEGWAKVTRECGVAAVTAGPGVTNSVTALAQAQSSDSPMFLIGGRAPEARWGMGSLQEMDHVPVVKSLTKKALTLQSAEDAYGTAAECMRTALSRRTGPVFIDVPVDVLLSATDMPEATEHLTPDSGPSPDPDLIQRTARLIKEAERPAVIAGGSVWWAHAEAELKELVESAHLPLCVNGMARGVLPPGHPLFFPRARAIALGEADLILVIGVPLDFRLNFGQHPVFPNDARLVYIDVDDHRKHRVAEGGEFVSFAGRLIERREPGLWIDPGPFGCLGSGPGYAMAAKLAHPDRQVILLSGDGAFGFSAMEFDTMVRHRIPVVCVVGNNGMWGQEEHPMQTMMGVSIAAKLAQRTRYDKVVEALGGHGEMVERPDQIRPALERAFKSGLPACINVICDPDVEYPRSSVVL